MKRIILMGALGVFAVSALASCKKDYTCDCTVNGLPLAIPITDAKKKDAQSSCDAAETTYSAAGTASCTLN